MPKSIRAILLLGVALAWIAAAAAPAFAARTPVIAVILLGSPEYLSADYYQITRETLAKKIPATADKLVIGDHPQQMFERFSDKQSLVPGEIPDAKTLQDFAWQHSFDEVIFLLCTPPNIRSKDVSIQWERFEVTVTARVLRVESRTREITADATAAKTVRMYHRREAIYAAFRQCLEQLRDRL